MVDELATGGRRPLARLLTRIENGDPSVRELLPALFAAGRGAHVVGVTGPPGSGKSTLVSALITEWRRRGRRVGVLAVDPSSPYTRGAILGDRIRMMEHAADRDVFMRSMASRGELGGLAATTWIAAAALDAAGFDPVVIETVGAGQSEVEVARLAETTVVVEVPEMGDEVQAIKAGLLEVADIIAVNKGDRPGADRAARQLRAMLSTAGGRIERTPPPVLMTTATSGDGVAELADAIGSHRDSARTPIAARERAAHQVRRALADLVTRRAESASGWDETLDAVAHRKLDPLTVAERALERGIHHVQLAAPFGSEPTARAFWAGTLGFEELEKPEALRARGGCWFRAHGIEVHVGIDDDFRPALKAHPGLVLADLDAWADRLAAAGHEVSWDDAFPGFRRFYTADPFGNRLELLEPDD